MLLFGKVQSIALSVIALISMATMCGCGPVPVPVSDPALAKQLLEETLENWKAGESWDSLQKKTQPVYVTEDLWRARCRLTNFSVLGEGELMASNIRFRVQLKCTSLTGKTTDRTVNYLVTTKPALTIAREEG